MLKRLLPSFILVILLLLFFATKVLAVVDPLAKPNNRFGIHILEPADLPAAAELVNSNGGNWGYVTLVIRQNDLNVAKWQEIFDSLRRLKLIPIVRLATVPEGENWVKPLPEDADKLAEFLNSLNWVTKNRYVVLFNEPNHAKEWGGQLKPQEYVQTVKEFREAFKTSSDDFFILPAGFDAAAPNSQDTMAATEYWRQMYLADSTIFQLFDGWNSHSYPNPNFAAAPTKTGLGSLVSYRAEIDYLDSLGLPPDLPIFITETGWSDQASDDLSDYYRQAFGSIWTDPNLVAVTPFVLNYPQAPFAQFSWQKPASSASPDFYPHYWAVKDLLKTAGAPEQIHSSELVDDNLSTILIDSSDYQFAVTLKNTGQSIWNRHDFELVVTSNLPPGSVLVTRVPEVEPGDTATFQLNLTTPEEHNSYLVSLQLSYQGQVFGEKVEQVIEVVSPPNLLVKAKQLLKSTLTGNDYRLLIYTAADNRLVAEHHLNLVDGQFEQVKLYGIVPHAQYRLVLLKPLYLPRQSIITLSATDNLVVFQPLLPLDFDRDGQFTVKDIVAAWVKPITVLKLFCLWCL